MTVKVNTEGSNSHTNVIINNNNNNNNNHNKSNQTGGTPFPISSLSAPTVDPSSLSFPL